MLIINTTYSLTPVLESSFLSWLKLTHLPQIIHENNLSKVKILKIQQNEELISYCVQFHCDIETSLNELKEKQAKYKHLLFKEFAQEVLSFSTELHLVEQYNLYNNGAS